MYIYREVPTEEAETVNGLEDTAGVLRVRDHIIDLYIYIDSYTFICTYIHV